MSGASKRAEYIYVAELSLNPYSGWQTVYRGPDSSIQLFNLTETNMYYLRVSYYVDLNIQASGTYNFTTINVPIDDTNTTGIIAPVTSGLTQKAATTDNGLSTGAIVGIAVGGAAVSFTIIWSQGISHMQSQTTLI